METKKITIDGKVIVLDRDQTILEAARQNNIHIPTLCHHPDLTAWGGCRLCLVQVDGSPRLAASCVTPVRDGMEVVTSNERILQSRRTILEFLFAERNHNCMVCPNSNDCELQTLAYELQMDHLTVSPSFDTFPTDITSPYMAFDHNRCVLCGRCVRACQEIAGARVLNFMNRGPETRIGFDLNQTRQDSSCHSCGVCLQVCPTGALVNRYRSHYGVQGHDKARWQQKKSFCSLCGLLCPTTCLVCDHTLLKVEGVLGRTTDRPDGGLLCAKGRFDVLKTKGQRLTHPLVLNEAGVWEQIAWSDAEERVADNMNQIASLHGTDAIGGVISGNCSNESLLLFKDLLAKWGSSSTDTLDGAHYRNFSKAKSLCGESWQEASWKSILQADFIFAVGEDSWQTHPMMGSLIHRQVMETGAKLAVIGKRDQPIPLAAWSFPVEAGKEPLLIRAMVKEAFDLVTDSTGISHWDCLVEQVKEIRSTDISSLLVDPEGVTRFHEMTAAFMAAKNPVILVGQEVTGSMTGSGLADAVTLASLKGFVRENILRLIVLKPSGNSAGAWQMGISSPKEPAPSMHLKGGLLFLSGEEEITDDFVTSMGDMAFFGVMTPYFSEALAREADILIPLPLWMEEEGTYTSLDGRHVRSREQILTPPDGIKSTQTLLSALAQKADSRVAEKVEK